MQIKINDKFFDFKKGQTVLEIARENNIDIPALCFHPDSCVQASCRMCLVEYEGKLLTSCTLKAEDGMEILTDSEEIIETRKINLQLIFAQHREECADCHYRDNCLILKLARDYKINTKRFKDRKEHLPSINFGDSINFDMSKCIDCGICIDICNKQGVGFFDFVEKDGVHSVCPSKRKDTDCIYCGQCITHCPVGAIEAVGEYEDSAKAFEKEEDEILVVQIAPSIRTSIGEDFGLEHGSVMTGQMVAGIKKLGADFVFDVSTGADFTTMEESKELIQRLTEKKNLPMFTSCCPAWVKFVEFLYPELIPNLTTTRSPHMISAALTREYWGKGKKIKLLSVMPCTAKKYDIKREEFKGLIDYVLTTRELAFLFKENNIDLVNIEPIDFDPALGIHSGAGVIYGASGGVTESALRTACNILTKEKCPVIDYKKLRGLNGSREAEVEIAGSKIKIAIVNSTGNIKKLIDSGDYKKYDFIEVMACPGGCIGGGGQPVPVSEEIRQKRADALYSIDLNKEIRTADQNPVVIKLYKEFLNEENIHHLMHTSYNKKIKEDLWK